MKAALALEYIGEACDARLALYSGVLEEAMRGLGGAVVGRRRPRKPWVAEITGRDAKYGLVRKFLPANWQRSRANSAHTRGVELWFVLEAGQLYEVNSPVSWSRSERYFCTVNDDGALRRLSGPQAEQWLNAASG